MRRRERIQSRVDDGGKEREHQVRGGESERDREQAAGGNQCAAEDEWHPPPEPATLQPVAPDPGHEGHRHSRRGVDEHDHPNQLWSVVDPLEEKRQVTRRHRAAEAGGERRCCESDDEGRAHANERPPRAPTECDRGHAALPTSSSARGMTVSSTVP
jgi:hypothetical protein